MCCMVQLESRPLEQNFISQQYSMVELCSLKINSHVFFPFQGPTFANAGLVSLAMAVTVQTLKTAQLILAATTFVRNWCRVIGQ